MSIQLEKKTHGKCYKTVLCSPGRHEKRLKSRNEEPRHSTEYQWEEKSKGLIYVSKRVLDERFETAAVIGNECKSENVLRIINKLNRI